MWNCKHCKKNFNFSITSDKANHSRWCDQNPKRNSWNKEAGSVKLYGKVKEFFVSCETCKQNFVVKEKEKLHPQKDKYFCSRSCANKCGGIAKSLKHYIQDSDAHYRTVAWRYHDKKCIVCNEDKIVTVHHINHVHNDNRPKNLVPLCPTHHQYMHSKHRSLIEDIVDKYIIIKFGDGDC